MKLHSNCVVALLLGVFLVLVVPTKSGGFVSEEQKLTASAIVDHFTKGPGKGQAYNWLARFTDKFGDRLPGSPQYDIAADFLMEQFKASGADRVWAEDAPGIWNWYRAADPDNPGKAELLKPRHHDVAIFALGNSTATPPGGIRARATVVQSMEELASWPQDDIHGRIVVFNCPWVGTYGPSVQCRGRGAAEAAKYGAVAALVRSVTPQSLYTLHTGMNSYPNDPKLQIPVASITVEDAELLSRLQAAGHQLEMSLEINSVFLGTIPKRNIIAEWRGTTHPHEMVVFGGHLDSWDGGYGALDDGGGVSISLQTLLAMKTLGLRPKRTLRAVILAAEEMGYIGARAYYEAHKSESSNISLAIESDSGTFRPYGFHFTGNSPAEAMLQEVMNLLEPINATRLIRDGVEPGDFEEFCRNDAVPGVELYDDGWDSHYFWYHHTFADTMTLLDSGDLDACSAVFATVAYVVADLDRMLPRK